MEPDISVMTLDIIEAIKSQESVLLNKSFHLVKGLLSKKILL